MVGAQYFATKDYFFSGNCTQDMGTYFCNKNTDVLRHLKDEICSIDEEIMELQNNLGLAIHR
jgi:hypothetical protein